MVVDVWTGTLLGLRVVPVRVEVAHRRGMRRFTYIGLPNAAVRESKDRIVRALESADLPVPKGDVLISLSPADVRKSGGALDLPIALAILGTAEVVPAERLRRYLVVGELGLTGSVRPVQGAMAFALAGAGAPVDRAAGSASEPVRSGLDGVILPRPDAEAIVALNELPLTGEVVGVDSLVEAIDFLRGGVAPTIERGAEASAPAAVPDLIHVRGQALAKRALVVTAAGGHNVLFSGPPGSGKTLLARRLPGLLPRLDRARAVESALIYSVTGRERGGFRLAPFRAPHHTVSHVGLVGGGNPPRPGEVSLAHHGILFLDELPEFPRPALESLRECVEEGAVNVVRTGAAERFPARFQLLAAMNPCPCGFATHPSRSCECSERAVARYVRRLSGALLDRFDLAAEVGPVPPEVLDQAPVGPDTAAEAARVAAARDRQRARNPGGCVNADLGPEDTRTICRLSAEAADLMRAAHARFALSARGYHRVLRVARTVADLGGGDAVEAGDVAEALRFRAFPTADTASRTGGRPR